MSKLLPETVCPTSPYTLQSSPTPHSVATHVPRCYSGPLRCRPGNNDLHTLAVEQAQLQHPHTRPLPLQETTASHHHDLRRQGQYIDVDKKALRSLFRKLQLAEYHLAHLPPRVNTPSSTLPASYNPHPTTDQRVVRFALPTPPSQRPSERTILEEKQTSSPSTQNSETFGPTLSLGRPTQPITNEGIAQRPLVISRPQRLQRRPQGNPSSTRKTRTTPIGNSG